MRRYAAYCAVYSAAKRFDDVDALWQKQVFQFWVVTVPLQAKCPVYLGWQGSGSCACHIGIIHGVFSYSKCEYAKWAAE